METMLAQLKTLLGERASSYEDAFPCCWRRPRPRRWPIPGGMTCLTA